MTLSAAAIRLMAEKGLSALDIAEIAEAMDCAPMQPSIDHQAERRRAADRERKKAARLRNVCGQSAETSADNAETTPFPSPSPSFPPDPPNNPTPTHTPGNNPRARKGTRLDEDWKPEPVIGKTAEMLDAWPPGAIDRELEKFRNYWLAKAGKDACKTSWQRTWINWLISADERIAKHGNDRQSSANRHRGRDGFLNACFEAAAGQAAYPTTGDG